MFSLLTPKAGFLSCLISANSSPGQTPTSLGSPPPPSCPSQQITITVHGDSCQTTICHQHGDGQAEMTFICEHEWAVSGGLVLMPSFLSFWAETCTRPSRWRWFCRPLALILGERFRRKTEGNGLRALHAKQFFNGASLLIASLLLLRSHNSGWLWFSR